jgi:hypothetical protein
LKSRRSAGRPGSVLAVLVLPVAIIASLLVLRFAPRAAAAMQVRRPVAWYVSSGEAAHGIKAAAAPGKDTNSGQSPKMPFATIQKAASVARPGDTIHIRGGVYRETVIPSASGEPGRPITFRPYGSETVSLRGTTGIAPGAWQPVPETPGLFSAPWPGEYNSANNQADQVFLDGAMAQLARWPEETNRDVSRPYRARMDRVLSSDKTEKVTPGPQYPIYRVTFYDAEFDQPDGRWVGAKFWVNTGNAHDEHDGNGQTGVVIATNAARREITVEVDAGGRVGDGSEKDRPGNFQFGRNSEYYFFDPPTRDGLLHAGSWWRDRASNRLYLRLKPNDSPARHDIEVKQRDWAFDLHDRSYITVQNVQLFGTSITTDRQAGDGRGNGNGRRDSVGPSHHIVLDGIQARYVTHFTDQSGNLQTQWDTSSGIILSGSDCILRNSDIAYSAGCGVVCIGERNKVLNNIIRDCNYHATDGGALGLGVRPFVVSRDTEVAYNTIYNTGIDGIEFGALKNSSLSRPGIARIHHNVVHDTVLQSADSGGMHTFASDGQWVRIDHNVVYNTGGPSNEGYLYFGIYLDYAPDDGKTPARYILDHNVVYNTPSPLNLNHANGDLIYNNTLISATKIARSSISSNGPGPAGYAGVELKNNLGNTVYRGDMDEQSARTGKVKLLYEKNVITAKDDWFVDAVNPDMRKRDYRLTDAAAKQLGAGVPVRPYQDGDTPYIGAYPYGKPKWKAGATQ